MKKGNGEGTIFYSEKLNRWVGQFVAGRKIDGSLNRKSVYGKTRKEVSEKMKIKLAEVQSSTFIDKNDITLSEVINLVIAQKENSNKLKQGSINRDYETLKQLKTTNLLEKPIQKITLQDLNQGLSVLAKIYSNSVIDKNYHLIRQAYGYAMLNDIITKDFFSIRGAVIKPKSIRKDKEVEALTIEEQRLLEKALKESNDKYKDILFIQLYTGMRIGEVLALTKDDIQDKIIVNKTLTRDKNDKYIVGDTTKTSSGTREIPILDILQPIINNLSFNEKYLGEINSHFITPQTINGHLQRIAAKEKIMPIKRNSTKRNKSGEIIKINSSRITTHMLRHTFATRCIESGMSPVVLQKILGHKNIEVTLNTYTSVFDKYKKDEIDKVNEYLSALH